jgi:predicted phage-related endonuclease
MIKYHTDLVQGSDEWLAARCGILTASEMKHIISPVKLQYANNDKERAHLYELLAQRVTGYVEPHYIGDDMLRGMEDEIEAKVVYAREYAEVSDIGFITNDKWGFTLGYSPDGMVGEDGLIECKSRRQRFQAETIISGIVPSEYMIQIQTALLVSERKWLDFISYSGGLPMYTINVKADEKIHAAIIDAATVFEGKLQANIATYNDMLKVGRLIPTERKQRNEGEITL